MKRYYLLLLSVMTLFSCKATKPAETEGVDVFKTPTGKEVVFHCIKHGSIRICYDGKEIEIDPVAKMQPATYYSTMPKADYIFVTHEHGDHFDKQAIAALTKEGTQMITNARCAEMLGYGKVMANGDKMDVAADIHVKGRTGLYHTGMDTAGQAAHGAVFVGVGYVCAAISECYAAVHMHVVHVGRLAVVTAEAAEDARRFTIGVGHGSLPECKVVHVTVQHAEETGLGILVVGVCGNGEMVYGVTVPVKIYGIVIRIGLVQRHPRGGSQLFRHINIGNEPEILLDAMLQYSVLMHVLQMLGIGYQIRCSLVAA